MKTYIHGYINMLHTDIESLLRTRDEYMNWLSQCLEKEKQDYWNSCVGTPDDEEARKLVEKNEIERMDQERRLLKSCASTFLTDLKELDNFSHAGAVMIPEDLLELFPQTLLLLRAKLVDPVFPLPREKEYPVYQETKITIDQGEKSILTEEVLQDIEWILSAYISIYCKCNYQDRDNRENILQSFVDFGYYVVKSIGYLGI